MLNCELLRSIYILYIPKTHFFANIGFITYKIKLNAKISLKLNLGFKRTYYDNYCFEIKKI